MSRSFGAGTDRITQGSAALPLTGSIALWFYPTWASTDFVDHTAFVVYASGSQIFAVTKYSDNRLYLGWYNGAEYRVTVNSGSYTINQNAWNHIAIAWDDTANETKAYLNGAQVGSTVSSLVAFDTAGTNRTIGNYASSVSNANFSGRIAEFSIWDAVLTADEAASLYDGISSLLIRPTSLTDYLPLIGRDSPEPNYIGGTAGTITSGTTQADHPRILYPRRRQRVYVAGAVATGNRRRRVLMCGATR